MKEFIPLLQLFDPADSMGTNCDEFHYFQHHQSSTLWQQNPVWPGTPITPSSSLKQFSHLFINLVPFQRAVVEGTEGMHGSGFPLQRSGSFLLASPLSRYLSYVR